jgi:hypothetical protein
MLTDLRLQNRTIANQFDLDASHLKTGIYLVSLETTEGKETKRLEVIN